MPPFTLVQKILVDLVVQIFYGVCCSIYSLMARLQGLWNLGIPQPHMIHKTTPFTTYPRQILFPLVRIFRCTPPLWGIGCRSTEMFLRSRLPFGLCCENLIIKSNDIMKLILKTMLLHPGDWGTLELPRNTADPMDSFWNPREPSESGLGKEWRGSSFVDFKGTTRLSTTELGSVSIWPYFPCQTQPLQVWHFQRAIPIGFSRHALSSIPYTTTEVVKPYTVAVQYCWALKCTQRGGNRNFTLY